MPDWLLLALVAGPAVVAGYWFCCCKARTSNCSTVLTGYCFQFSVSGVANNSPLQPGWPCQFCPDFNGTWLLIPNGPIDSVDNVCHWTCCRPPVCCGYPTPVVGAAPRWTMSNVAKKNSTTDWVITGGCTEVQYRLGSPNLSTGTNTFKLVPQTPMSGVTYPCINWPKTITVTGIPPHAISSQTKTATVFNSVSGAPNEPGGMFASPGEPWTPNTALTVQPNPYANNTNANITDWLICSNFGFTIPSTAWITGISIAFKRWSDQRNVANDNAVTVGLNYNIAAGFLSNVYANSTAWPLFSETRGADVAIYGGQYDQWGLGGEATIATDFIDTPDWSFAVSANALAMRQGAIHIDPASCQMTVYYVTIPCGDNCCACPPVPSTGNPPSAYKVTFPSPAGGCSGSFPQNAPTGCQCSFVFGNTFELPYNALLSVPTYRCVYSVTVGFWSFSLTITNISPDARQFQFVGGTSSACSLPNQVTSGGFFEGIVQQSGPNFAISQCGPATISPVADTFNCFCLFQIHIGGGGTPTPLVVTVSPVT